MGAGLLDHSDRGSTYTSEDYREVLATYGITGSMSRRGNCYDNAVMEAFFSALKSEIGNGSRATPAPRPTCPITSRCSITSGAGTQPQVG